MKIEAIRSKTRRWCRVPIWQLLQAVSAAIKKIPLVTLPPPVQQRCWVIHLPMEYLVPPQQNPRLKNSKTPKGKNQWDNVIFKLPMYYVVVRSEKWKCESRLRVFCDERSDMRYLLPQFLSLDIHKGNNKRSVDWWWYPWGSWTLFKRPHTDPVYLID